MSKEFNESQEVFQCPTYFYPHICSSHAHDMTMTKFVTMRPSHVSGEQSDQVTDLLAVTVQIICCHCTPGSVLRETMVIIEGGKVTTFFCQLLPKFSRDTNRCENPMLMTITNKKRWAPKYLSKMHCKITPHICPM